MCKGHIEFKYGLFTLQIINISFTKECEENGKLSEHTRTNY